MLLMALVGYPGTKVLTSQPRVAAVCSVKGCWGSPKLKIHYLLFPDSNSLWSGKAQRFQRVCPLPEALI